MGVRFSSNDVLATCGLYLTTAANEVSLGPEKKAMSALGFGEHGRKETEDGGFFSVYPSSIA